MMNYVWVLSVKTSLPNTCASHADLPLTTTVYDSFEKARAALREDAFVLDDSPQAVCIGDDGGRQRVPASSAP